MAGIYGSSMEDRYFERQLHKFLDDQEVDEEGMTATQRRRMAREETIADNYRDDDETYRAAAEAKQVEVFLKFVGD